ncbi:hypothetical protein Scep_030929 [Stephania cephalantha]|uniref:Knotted 1-binding protein 36 n=1 Tax=Stephania cephalantha TaxID=152367 RepID=A0AAP0E8E1_9MAGN
MESEDVEARRKRQKQTVVFSRPILSFFSPSIVCCLLWFPCDLKENEENEGGVGQESAAEGDIEASFVGSEEMQMQINAVLEKIERFTQLVSELLESGKTLFKELSDRFEERLITIHREEIEKWQEEIKALRMLDMSNEEANMLLLNAKQLLHNVQMET